MRYVAAYLLASLGGNKNPSASDVEKILGSVGIEVDKERVKKVIAELGGKNLDEVIANGKTKLASMPSGGAVATSAAAAPAGGAAGSPAKEEKKKAKKEESEESEDDMGFGLFD